MTESNEMCHDNSNKEWKPTHAETGGEMVWGDRPGANDGI